MTYAMSRPCQRFSGFAPSVDCDSSEPFVAALLGPQVLLETVAEDSKQFLLQHSEIGSQRIFDQDLHDALEISMWKVVKIKSLFGSLFIDYGRPLMLKVPSGPLLNSGDPCPTFTCGRQMLLRAH